MRTLKISIVAAAAIAYPALAANYSLQIVPMEGQIVRMEQGRQIVDSPGEKVTVRLVQPKAPTPKRSGFRAFAMNGSSAPFNFGPSNISASFGESVTAAMLTYDQLASEARRRQGWQAFAVGMAAASRSMNAANAGYVSGTGTYSGTTYGSYGSTPYRAQTYGTATYSGYDAGRAQIAGAIAQEQNRADFQALAAAQAANMEGLNALMQTTTVDPGSAFGGIVLFDVPKEVKRSKVPIPVTFTIEAGGEVHHFKGTLQKAR